MDCRLLSTKPLPQPVLILLSVTIAPNLREVWHFLWRMTIAYKIILYMPQCINHRNSNFVPMIRTLTHWDRVMHICVGKTISGSDNGLSPRRRQTIIWTNDGILLIWPLGTNFSEILSEIHSFSFKKMHLKTVCEMASTLFRPQCVRNTWNMHWHEIC